MLQSKITLVEGVQVGNPMELTLAKFSEDPTMLILEGGNQRLKIELNDRQLLQLMHFINILLETH